METAHGPEAESKALVTVEKPAELARQSSLPPSDMDSARQLVADAHAPSTRRAYEESWKVFRTWCVAEGRSFMPASPETVVLFIDAMKRERRAYATVARCLAAISYEHQNAGHDSPRIHPAVRRAMKGLARQVGRHPKNSKDAMVTTTLKRLLDTIPKDTLRGKRDRALLLLGFAGAFRRGELVGLRVEELSFLPDGDLEIRTTRRLKTNPEGELVVIRIEAGDQADTCPVTAIREWLKASGAAEGGIKTGPVFLYLDPKGRLPKERTGLHPAGDHVRRLVKEAAKRAGLDPDRLGAHSLRSGVATQLLKEGVDYGTVALHLRQKGTETLRRHYDKRLGLNLPRVSKRAGL